MSVMATKERKPPMARPFPWRCSDCGMLSVVPTVIDYTSRVKHDGAIRELMIPGLEVPRCHSCGNLVITTAVDEKINDFVRSKFGLLSPDQIRGNIKKLGLTQQELAEWLDVAPETISRWMTGALIQSSRMNKRLRMFFAFPEAREMLQRLDREPQLGMEVNLQQGSGENSMPTDKSSFKPEDIEVLAFRFYHAARDLGLVEEMRLVRRHASQVARDDYPLPETVFEEDRPTEAPFPIAQFAAIWNRAEREAQAEEEDWGTPFDGTVTRNGISISVSPAKPLPFRFGKPVRMWLRVGGAEYRAELRSTKTKGFARICPDVFGPRPKRQKLKLGQILVDAGFEPNERIELLVAGKLIAVHKLK